MGPLVPTIVSLPEYCCWPFMRTVCPSSNAPCHKTETVSNWFLMNDVFTVLRCLPTNAFCYSEPPEVTLGYAHIKIGFLQHHFAHLDKYKMWIYKKLLITLIINICHGGTSVFCCRYFASKHRASLGERWCAHISSLLPPPQAR